MSEHSQTGGEQDTAWRCRVCGYVHRGMIAAGMGLLAAGCAYQATAENGKGLTPSTRPKVPRILHVEVREGAFDCDLYLPSQMRPAPLVVVVHGFARSKASMADWGRQLAREGLVAAVPTLPAWSDHARNGRAIRQLADWLQASPDARDLVDARRIGLVGFSAGGLSTLLAAADDPRAAIWVGLDPVDRDGQGAAVASRLKCPSLILRAEPHACNAHGNATGIVRALGSENTCLLVVGATHTDAEWPTDGMAEWFCGKSSPQQREVFVQYAVAALRATLLLDQAAAVMVSKAQEDTRVKVLNQGD